MKKLFLFLFLALLCYQERVSAQVEWSGIADVGFTMGGSDSKYISNGISNRYPNFSLMNLNLFLGSQISEDFSFSGKLLYAPAQYGYGSYPRLVFASVNYDPAGETFGFSVGRVLTPFGLYAKRQHSTENISFLPPLVYGYFINISNTKGFWPGAGDLAINYGSDDVGLNSVFQGGYQMGLKGYYAYEDLIDVELMFSNAPVSAGSEVKNNGSISGSGRVGYKPVMWANLGVSGSYGSFMERTGENSVIGNIQKYKQLTLGTDASFAYSYFELSGEYIYSSWTTPKFAKGAFVKIGDTYPSFELVNHGAYADLKIEIPQVPGLFVAGRFDRIWFEPVQNVVWDLDHDRFTGVIGYTWQKGVLLKLVGFTQTNSGAVDLKEDGLAALITVSF